MLLVEDEHFVREATCRILESAGYEVLPAGDAQEAVKIYELHHDRIDLLMTDMTLPGRGGRQLSQDLRSTSPELAILLTSGYVENDCDREPQEPKTYFLPKPYSRSELVAMLEKIFRVAVQQRAASQAS